MMIVIRSAISYFQVGVELRLLVFQYLLLQVQSVQIMSVFVCAVQVVYLHEFQCIWIRGFVYVWQCHDSITGNQSVMACAS